MGWHGNKNTHEIVSGIRYQIRELTTTIYSVSLQKGKFHFISREYILRTFLIRINQNQFDENVYSYKWIFGLPYIANNRPDLSENHSSYCGSQ